MFGFFRKKKEGASVPPTSWFAQEAENTKNTPDVPRLEAYKWQLLFVYDELQRGHHKHDLAEGSVHLGTVYTRDKFSVWKKNLGRATYPIPLQKQFKTVPYAPIKGELRAFRPNQYFFLDKHKQNGVQYTRKRVTVLLPYRKLLWLKERDAAQFTFGKAVQNSVLTTDPYIREIRAWMYVGIPEFWMELIDGGYAFSPVTTYTPNTIHIDKYTIERYYYFSTNEYSPV